MLHKQNTVGGKEGWENEIKVEVRKQAQKQPSFYYKQGRGSKKQRSTLIYIAREAGFFFVRIQFLSMEDWQNISWSSSTPVLSKGVEHEPMSRGHDPIGRRYGADSAAGCIWAVPAGQADDVHRYFQLQAANQ